MALDAEMVIRGAGGERVVSASEFWVGVFETACGPDELLVEIRVPKLDSTTGWSYVKMARRAQDWATVAVAAIVRRSNGSIESASVGLTNMGATPLRATRAEEALAGGASIADAAEVIPSETEPPSDTVASADFRRHLSKVIGRRTLEGARAR